jgi:hypothetical protein
MPAIPGAEGGQVPLRGDSHAPGELLAEGDGGAITERLSVSEDTVQKYAGNISDMLWLPPSPDDHRRVLAVVACVSAQQ